MRLAIIVAVAVVGFAAAWFLAGREAPPPEPAVATPPAASPSATETEAPPPYDVTVTSEPDPPAPAGTTFVITVMLDGQPVTGAEVTMQADMSDMAHEGVQNAAEELGEGRYQLSLSFPMRGGWSGRVAVAEPGKPRFTMPVSFVVE